MPVQSPGTPDDLLRVGAEPEADLQHLSAAERDLIQAPGDVWLAFVAEAVVLGEEPLIADVIGPGDEMLAARISRPERLDLGLVHATPPRRDTSLADVDSLPAVQTFGQHDPR